MPKRPINNSNWRVTLSQKKIDGDDQVVHYVAPAPTTALHLQNNNSNQSSNGRSRSSSSSSNNSNNMPLVSDNTTPAAAATAPAAAAALPITAVERDMELDAGLSLSSSGGNASWIQRVPWLRSRRDRDVNKRDDIYLDSLKYQDGEAIYHGGAMETTTAAAAAAASMDRGDTTTTTTTTAVTNATVAAAATTTTTGSRKPPLQQTSPFARIASFLSNTSLNTRDHWDESSLEDFDESEWTPQDSSYGAAIPIGGWIPKAIRRLIELSLIGLVVFALAFFIVTTSMRIGSDDETPSNQSNKNGGNDYAYDGGVGLDDDNYIEYKNRNNNNNNNIDNDDDAFMAEDAVEEDDDAVAVANDDDVVNANDDAYVYVDDQYNDNGEYNYNNDNLNDDN